MLDALRVCDGCPRNLASSLGFLDLISAVLLHSVLGQERLHFRDKLEQRIQIDFSLRVA